MLQRMRPGASAVIRSILIHIVNSAVLFFGVFFVSRMLVGGDRKPLARQVCAIPPNGDKGFRGGDISCVLVIPLVLYLYDRMFADHPFPQMIQNLPMLARITLYFLIADFGYY